MWFQVRHADLSFTQRSPFQFENEAIIQATPARVFEILATAERQKEWFKDFIADRWTSAPPHGVGSTREVELKTLTVKERFLAWDPGKRIAFSIYAITLPLINEMVEDLQLEPHGDGGTRFRWVAHYTPSLLMRLAHGTARAQFGEMFRATTAGLKAYAESNPRAQG